MGLADNRAGEVESGKQLGYVPHSPNGLLHSIWDYLVTIGAIPQ